MKKYRKDNKDKQKEKEYRENIESKITKRNKQYVKKTDITVTLSLEY
jgi:hypothetical protein